MTINEKNRLFVWLCILSGIGIITGIILHFRFFSNFDIATQNDLPNWLTLLETILGIGITLIIYDHAKKIEILQ